MTWSIRRRTFLATAAFDDPGADRRRDLACPDGLDDVRVDHRSAVDDAPRRRSPAGSGVTATPWPKAPFARSIWRHGWTAGSRTMPGTSPATSMPVVAP